MTRNTLPQPVSRLVSALGRSVSRGCSLVGPGSSCSISVLCRRSRSCRLDRRTWLALAATCTIKIARKIPTTMVCEMYVSESWPRMRCCPSSESGRVGSKENETDMKNGENVVKLVVPEIGISEVDCPTINTRTAKTRRGTASHKTDDNGGRERVILAVK